MSPDLHFLVLHELSWFQLLDYALISKTHLRLVQSYLKCYPKRINHPYVFRCLATFPDKLPDYSLLDSDNYHTTTNVEETEPYVPWSYELLNEQYTGAFWSGPGMAWYRQLLGLKVPASCDAK